MSRTIATPDIRTSGSTSVRSRFMTTTSPRPRLEASTLSARRAAGLFESQRPSRPRAQNLRAIAGGWQAHRPCIELSGEPQRRLAARRPPRCPACLQQRPPPGPLAQGGTDPTVLIELRVSFQQVRVELRLRVREGTYQSMARRSWKNPPVGPSSGSVASQTIVSAPS
jgi:hypothetical protein